MTDDVWRQMARDNPGMAIYRQFNPQTMSGTRFGAQIRDSITDEEAEQIKARFLAAQGQPPVWLDEPPADKSWIEMECAPRRRWWHRWIRL